MARWPTGARPGITLAPAVASMMAAASGLHHVHEQGVLHRDVKPENLMFDGRGMLKVTDFGIARSDDDRGDHRARLTRAGEFFGTPGVHRARAGRADRSAAAGHRSVRPPTSTASPQSSTS